LVYIICGSVTTLSVYKKLTVKRYGGYIPRSILCAAVFHDKICFIAVKDSRDVNGYQFSIQHKFRWMM